MAYNDHPQKNILVTGGASGIGLGIVERFLAEEARVVCFDLNAAPLHHPRLVCFQGDVTSPEDVQNATALVVSEFGRLDVLVANAGVIEIAPVVDMEFAAWKRLIDINLHGVFLALQAAARVMLAQGQGGAIIAAASGAGRRGVPNLSGYCASKAAIINLVQSLAIELAPHDITVNSYVPGHIQTPFWDKIAKGFSKVTGQSPEAVIEGFRASVPMGRFGTPQEVAATVSWLASADARYVSGQAIAMNGAEFPY